MANHSCPLQKWSRISQCLILNGQPLRNILADKAWLAPVLGKKALPAKKFIGNPSKAIWLPNQEIAKIWMHYVSDTEIPDLTPPPSPTNIRISNLAPKKHRLSWDAQADIESGLSYFIIKISKEKGQGFNMAMLI